MLATATSQEGAPGWGVRRFLKRQWLIRGCAFLATLVLLKWLMVLGVYAGVLPGEDLFPRVDFAAFWAASSLALEGHAASAYELRSIWQEQMQLPGNDNFFQPWRNPPIFFLLVLPLALFPFALAFAGWVLATGAIALSAVRRMSNDTVLVSTLALAFPATIGNILVGQTGLLMAGLFGWGMLLLRDRPQVAGVLLGLLVFKPQFFPLVLVALVAGRETRAAASALATVAALSLASLLLFGLESWEGFLSMVRLSSESIYGGDAPLGKVQSVSASLLLLGTPILVAQVLQALFAGACVVFVYKLWRSDTPFEVRAAGLVLATLLATPYSYLYDLTLLGLAILWLVSAWGPEVRSRGRAELLVLAWLTPLSSPLLGFSIASGVLLVLLIFVHRSRRDEALRHVVAV